MSDARSRILERLRANRPAAAGDSPPPVPDKVGWTTDERIARFSTRMQAVRGEVHRVRGDDWVDWLNAELPARGLHRALIGTGPVADTFAARAAPTFTLHRYDRPIEEWKPALFNAIDFAVTGAVAAIAETGSLVLWPDRNEPRLMSLVPPLHVAVLDVQRLFDDFAGLIAAEHWAAGMPTNALLVSGPSKTADIEQTLAYGIHGPKALVTLLVE